MAIDFMGKSSKLARKAVGAGTALGIAALVLTPGGIAAAQRAKPAPDQLVPLYADSSASDWATVCSGVSGAHGGSYVIADVDQGLGAGPAPVAAYSTAFDTCLNSGRASILGYVWSDYGEGGMASISSIEAQVNQWYSYYPGDIGGIFFDGASDSNPLTGASNVTFYQTLDSYVHQHEGDNDEVVLNYGASPGSGWMFNSSNAKNADIVVTFEGSYNTPGENPYTSWAPASWESQYPADDFAALVYDAYDATDSGIPQPATACSALSQQNLGYLYVGSWYTNLAPNFSQMVADC